MNEFYEVAGIQSILRYLDYVQKKVEEYEYETTKKILIAATATTRCYSYDDPSLVAKICSVLSSCSFYSREHSNKIVELGGIDSLVALNERYLDEIVLSPCPNATKIEEGDDADADPLPSFHGYNNRNDNAESFLREGGRRRKLEWEVLLGIWEIFESLSVQQILSKQVGAASNRIVDASLDTLEFLQSVDIEEVPHHSFLPHIMCKVFATLDHSLCRSSLREHHQASSTIISSSSTYYSTSTRTMQIRHNRILPNCLRAMRDPATGDWRESFSDPRDFEAEIALLKTVFRFLVGFVLLVRQQTKQQQQQQTKQQQQQQPNNKTPRGCLEGEFEHVILFGVEQILRSPSRALAGGAFCAICRLCRTRGEKDFLRHHCRSLKAALEAVVESRDAEAALKKACEALLGHVYEES
jgi:hypothetical protein